MSNLYHNLNRKHLCHRLAQIALLMVLTIGLSLASPISANAAPTLQVNFDCVAVTEIPKTECKALEALYNNTNGAQWHNNTGWLTTNTPCSWFGVICEGGSVTWLLLSSNQLSGTLPPALGTLINLQRLYLDTNQLSGSIPPALGNLTNLQRLHLYTNQLSGSIPPALGILTNLQILYLRNNQLSGTLPPALGTLTNLQELDLAINQLSGPIPTDLDNLTNLLRLHLYDNQLTGSIPPELGKLTKLQELSLRNNQFSGALPPELGKLTNLLGLWLHNNQLSGSIPLELGNLANLRELYLDGNQLSGSIPPELGKLTNLQWLYLHKNQLSGPIPTALGNLTNLLRLHLYDNQLSGSIPSELGKLTKLHGFWLHDNQLSGSIPPELGNLTNLLGLWLYNNQLSGSIPLELGKLTKLEGFYLHNNQLSGSIPPELGNLTNLRALYLPNNQLSGNIPPQLGNLSFLDQLRLDTNQLRGSIPASLCTLPLSHGADFGYNQLTAADPCLATLDPDWAQTQTVPPTNVQVLALANQQVQLTWTPITYTADGGYYAVLDAPTSGGPYTVIGQTADKTAIGITLPPLGPGSHHLVVRTFTPRHDPQQNDLTSDNSAEVLVVFNTPPLVSSEIMTVTQGRALSILLAASDVDADTLSYALVSLPVHGLLSGTAPTLTYTSAAGFTGTDSFTFKANDGQADSNLATLTIQVVAAPPINTAPVAYNHTITTTQSLATRITLSATDGEGDSLTYQVISPPVHGALGGIAPALVYTPTPGYNGADSFTYQVHDGQLDSAVATVQINVTTQPNRPPTAQDDQFTVARNSQNNTLAVLNNDHDLDGDGLMLVAVAAPIKGRVQLVNGQLRYTPTTDFMGVDQFTYTVSDGKATVGASVSVTVAGAPSAAVYLPLVQR